MGTRSTIQVLVGKKPILSTFNMFDGYLGGNSVGSKIAKVLGRKNVNGVQFRREEYNGPGNFAFILMNELGRECYDEHTNTFEAGYYYLEFPDTVNDDCVEYNYTIKFSKKDETKPPKVRVKTYDYDSGWLIPEDFIKLNKAVQDGKISI